MQPFNAQPSGTQRPLRADRDYAVTGSVNSISLRQLDRRDRPPAFVTSDRKTQAVKFIKPDFVHRPRLSVSEDDGPIDKLGLSLVECGKNSARSR
jgi:hypothetical protein